MAKFTIELPDKVVTKLQPIVTRYNANMGKELTVPEWVVLLLKERVIATEFSSGREQREKERDAAFEAQEQQRWQDLLAAVDK